MFAASCRVGCQCSCLLTRDLQILVQVHHCHPKPVDCRCTGNPVLGGPRQGQSRCLDHDFPSHHHMHQLLRHPVFRRVRVLVVELQGHHNRFPDFAVLHSHAGRGARPRPQRLPLLERPRVGETFFVRWGLGSRADADTSMPVVRLSLSWQKAISENFSASGPPWSLPLLHILARSL